MKFCLIPVQPPFGIYSPQLDDKEGEDHDKKCSCMSHVFGYGRHCPGEPDFLTH
jgi:hypothetical protein